MIGTLPRVSLRLSRRHPRYRLEQIGGALPVDLPVTPDEVCRIASRGYPLRESIPAMQLRNRRITLAYADLSGRLADLIAGPNGGRDANWCTFGTWTSRTVGTWIDDDAVPEPLRNLRHMPRTVWRWLVSGARWLVQRSNGSSYRCLAAGNRFVFLEIGFAVALFVERFEKVDRRRLDEDAWTGYWDEIKARVTELSRLDPSWLLTDAPEPADLWLGLRQYYEAIFATDRDERSELVLAGNLLIGAYEQRRVDGYVSAALALFTKRALRNLVQHRSGVVSGWLRRPASAAFARLMTRGLVLNTCDEQLKVGQRLPPPANPPGSPMFPADLDDISLPILQALLTRYDLTEGKPKRCRVRDWTSYDQRMSYITSLFRSRQQCASLFSRPFPPELEAALLAGHLPAEAEPGDAVLVPAAVTEVVAQELVN